MKVAVTGHSEGLGKAIAARISRDGHEIRGFSLDNGYDISTEDGFRRVVNEALDCDAFVNCAHDRKHHGFGQTAILAKLFYHWQDQKKHIVNIGSDAPDRRSLEMVPFAARYRAAKTALDAACVEISSMGKPCRVSLVRPAWLDSEAAAQQEQVTGVKLDKLDYDEVADLVAMVLEMGPRITIHSITLARTIGSSQVQENTRTWWRRWA